MGSEKLSIAGVLRDENDILIINTATFTRIFLSIFALMLGFGGFMTFLKNTSEAFHLIFGILFFLVGLISLSADTRVVIDKKSQSVIIESKEIRFSEINYVEIIFVKTGNNPVDDLYEESWNINLNTNQGSTRIYKTSWESDALKIAEKIGRLTDKEIRNGY